MNEVQTRIAALQAKGWTLAAIADEVELTVNAVEKWKAGVHSPNKATLAFLDQLLTRKRIPKKRRYQIKQDGQSTTKDIPKSKKSP
jgi:transcriptional regulator with XRE-family HTH domain